jgi:excisionase family DNA binding protein
VNPVIPCVGPSLHAVSSSAHRPVPAKGATLERPSARSGSHAFAQDRDILRDEDRLLRLKAIAAETDVSEKTVRRWIDLRGLRSQKLGGLRVVRKRDLLAFLNQKTSTGK